MVISMIVSFPVGNFMFFFLRGFDFDFDFFFNFNFNGGGGGHGLFDDVLFQLGKCSGDHVDFG